MSLRLNGRGSKILPAVVISMSAAMAGAQFETSSVLGFVRDASGAAVPGATVTLREVQTGLTQTAMTDAQGQYQFASVKLGRYTVSAELAGFAKTETPEFRLEVNSRQRVDVDLKNGSVNETVTVSSAPTLLQTETSDRGLVIGTHSIEDLPLNGRSYADLALLTPGVRRSVLENQSTTSREASFNVNGMRSAFNNFLLDGLDNNNYGTSNQGFANENIAPSPDAVEEFRIETQNYSAEYGRNPGAVINVAVRRGTNEFHGRAWDYNRNTALNAIGPFAPYLGVKPTFIRNQFGGTFGGPIFKDRTFFFADYEGTRQISRTLTQVTLPTADQRNGIFQLHYDNGTTAPIPLRNPVTGRVYANGVVPTTDMTPFARSVLALLPANTVGVTGSNGFSNNFISTPRGTLRDDKGDFRLDHKWNDKILIFGRYSQHEATIIDALPFPGNASGNSNGNVHIYNADVAAGVTYSISANKLLDVRVGFGWNEGGKTPFGLGQPSLLTANGITDGIPTDPRISRILNGQSVSGFAQFGAQTSNPQFQNPFVVDPKVNYTWLKGRQSLKFGYEFQSITTAIDDFNPVYGADTYGGSFSANGTPTTTGAANASTQIGEARNLADFMFGNRSAYQLNNFVIISLLQKMNFMYVQDDIKVMPNLTINAGLRYELVTPQYVDGNHLANFDPTTNSLIQARDGSIYNRALVNMQYGNLAPRFGFAYSPNTRTALRGGYGITYTQFNREGGENLLAYNGPYIVGASITQQPSFGLCQNDTQDQTTCFRQTQQGYSSSLVSPAAFNPLKVQARYIPKNNPTGYVQSWFGGVQVQVPAGIVLDLAYVGTKGTHLMVLGDQNQAGYQGVSSATCSITPTATGAAIYQNGGCASLQSRRPITNFAGIEVATGVGYSNYNALQFSAQKRYSNGLSFINSFTWSRAFDDASGHLEATQGDNSRVNLQSSRYDYGPSGYDQPLNNTTSIVWTLPYGKGQRFGGKAPYLVQAALGGWELTAINTATLGLPINVYYSVGSGYTVSSLLTYRPNQVGKVLAPVTSHVKTATALTGYFNQTNVQTPLTANPFGNIQRNAVRGPNFNQFDLGVHKQFPLGFERAVLDLRGEAFNVLNHVNYTAPDSDKQSGTFGQITGFFPARQLQVAAKIIF